MKQQWRLPLIAALLATLAAHATAADWYARVKILGVKEAAAADIALFEKGQLQASLHVGDCYYHLERFAEGAVVFEDLRRKPDRNYAAAAMVRQAEGLVRLSRKAEAKALFAGCLEAYPEAFLDVDIPELCRVWLTEIGDVEAEEKATGDVKTPGTPAKGGETVRSEIRQLEADIADLKKRIAGLKALLSEGD
jgi:hypothetical protein